MIHVANLSAKKAKTSALTRFSYSQVYCGGSKDHATPPPQGSSTHNGLVFFMLPKNSRLTTSEVAEVLAKGSSIYISLPKGQRGLISAKFLPKSGGFKSAAVAPKSLAKSAVERNRLRRAIYRAISSLPAPQKGGFAVFFVRSIPNGPLTPAFDEEISIFLDKISS